MKRKESCFLKSRPAIAEPFVGKGGEGCRRVRPAGLGRGGRESADIDHQSAHSGEEIKVEKEEESSSVLSL